MNYSSEIIEIKEENRDEKKNILSCKLGCLSEIVPYFSKKEVRYTSIPMTIYEYKKHSYKKDFYCSKCHKKVKISVGSFKSTLSRYKLIIGFFLFLFLFDLIINFENIDKLSIPLTQTAIVLTILMIFSLLIALIDNFGLHKSLRSYKISLKTEGRKDIEKYHILLTIERFSEKKFLKRRD